MGTDNSTPLFYHKKLDPEHAECEQIMVSLIDAVDPKEDYHIGHPEVTLPPGTCCSDTQTTLTYRYGGTSLIDMDYASVTPEDFLRGFANIFRAIVEFSKIDFYHLDIKLSNILVDEYIHFRMIDFGISASVEYPIQETIFLQRYELWPYETILLTDCDNYFSDDLFKEYITLPYFRSVFPKIKNSVNDIKLNLISLKQKYKDRRALRLAIYEKIDVYSLGITLITIIQKLHVGALKKNLYSLALKMANFDTVKRLTAVQAYHEYMKIIHDI